MARRHHCSRARVCLQERQQLVKEIEEAKDPWFTFDGQPESLKWKVNLKAPVCSCRSFQGSFRLLWSHLPICFAHGAITMLCRRSTTPWVVSHANRHTRAARSL